MVAVMTDLLELKPDDVVLEIGTGLGYQSAVLAELAGSVYTVEIIDELAQRAVQRLHQHRGSRRERLFRLARARAVRQGDRYSGAPPHSTSANQSAQGWRKDGDPSRTARRPTASRGRYGHERQGQDEGNYGGIVLIARGERRAFIPRILTTMVADISGRQSCKVIHRELYYRGTRGDGGKACHEFGITSFRARTTLSAMPSPSGFTHGFSSIGNCQTAIVAAAWPSSRIT